MPLLSKFWTFQTYSLLKEHGTQHSGVSKGLEPRESWIWIIFGNPGKPHGDFASSDEDTPYFDPAYHLSMDGLIGRADSIDIDSLGEKKFPGELRAKFFLEGGNDDDPLKYWGHGKLPENVKIDDRP